MEFNHLKKVMETASLVLIDNIISDMNAGNKNASGKLAASLSATTFSTPELIITSMFGDDYWKWFDGGRPPGKQPPLSNIQKWVSQRGIDPAAAYPIARKIGREGTEATHIFTDNINAFEKQVDLLNAIFKDLDSELDKIITDANKINL